MNDKPRQVLKKLLADYGMSLAGDRGRCSALLRDLCSGFKAETHVLIAAMDEGIPAALVKDCNSGPVRLLVERLTKRLQDDRHLTRDAALWAVESWVFALGIAEDNEKPDPDPVSMEELYKAFIGPNNQDYYLRHFERFDREGEEVSESWNWSAFFLGFLWFLYRKMWRNACIFYLLMPLITLFISIAIGIASQEFWGHVKPAALPIFFFVWVIFDIYPKYANADYYRHCQKQIDRVKNLTSDPNLQLQQLSASGGTDGEKMFLLGILLLFGVGIVAGILNLR